MRLLLDSHAFIWFLNGNNTLPTRVLAIIEDKSNDCYLSIASIWEIGIKVSNRKLELQGGFDQLLEFMSANAIELLPLNFTHVQQLINLPFHHRDPFDRIIIAQAMTESLTILTKDSAFDLYGVDVLWN